MTLGSDRAGPAGAETVDYGGVRNALAAAGSRRVRIDDSDRGHRPCRRLQPVDPGARLNRRSERLVRARGHPYTIVRPGWFDYNTPIDIS